MTNEQIYAEIGKKFLEREQLSARLQQVGQEIQTLYGQLKEEKLPVKEK